MKMSSTILVASFGLICGQARAVDLFLSSSSRVTDLNQNPNAQDDNQQFDISTSPAYLNMQFADTSVIFGPGAANANAAGRMGLLKAKAFSSYPFLNMNEYAESDSYVAANDVLRATSTTLSNGTIVWVDFDLMLDGTVSLTPSEQSGLLSAYAQAILGVSSPSGGSNGNLNISYITNSGPVHDLVGSVQVQIGSVIQFSYSLEANTYTHAEATLAHSASVDFYDTARMFVAPRDTGNVTISADSGYNYSPVPEPATIAIFGLGFLQLRSRRRRS